MKKEINWKDKKVLVNGASGFIGSNLARTLFEKGAKIYSIDNFSYIDAEMSKRKNKFLDKITIIEGDMSKKETWENVPKDIEYLFHFAAPSSVTLFKRTPEKCLNETIMGFYNALEFAKKNNVKKVIYPTTGSNYAGNEKPHREDIYPKPRNLYAASKIACEGLANSYSDYVKSLGLRIFCGYGPHEEYKKDFGSVTYLFIRDYLNGKSPEVWGDGGQTRDNIYVDDIVKCIIAGAETEYTGIVNVGTGKSVSFKEVLEIIKETLGTEIEPTYIPKGKDYVEHLEADTTLMKEVLGVEPISPREGIKKFIEYLKK